MLDTSNSRERLLEAADELMYARGYEAVSVADLCTAADARKGSFYHWWPSKRDLALAMLDRAWERNRERLFEPVFDNGDSVVVKFRAYAELLADGLVASRDKSGLVSGCRYGNFAVELSTRDEVIRSRVAATLGRIRGVFESAIEDAIEAGEVSRSVDAGDTACAILAQMEGLMVLAKANEDPDMLRRLGPVALKLMGIDDADAKKRRPH